jgi:MATE family multidrug resistance protein
VEATLIIALWSCKDVLANIASKDPDVVHLVSQLIQMSCLLMTGDVFHATNGGILRGLGKQKIVFGLNVLAYLILAVPIGATLAFKLKLGVFGLWWGTIIGCHVSGIVGMCYLYHVDWVHEVNESLKRLSSGGSRPNTDAIV